MILIADGGSTKCAWIGFDSQGNTQFETRTKGLNPAVFSSETICNRISENKDLVVFKDQITSVYFYGAGCGTQTPNKDLKILLSKFFSNAIVDVKEDTLAAAYSVTKDPAIVCILGTGSNSCYFDGETTHTELPSLGYILMDEASGNYFGKRLIRDYFYKKMPSDIAREFEKNFNMDPDFVKTNLYKKENPNTYLASFAEFIFKHKSQSYCYTLLEEGIEDFFVNRILIFKNCKELPIHFIGSIAYFSSEIIEKLAKKHKLTLGKIVKSPINGLLNYHKNVLTH